MSAMRARIQGVALVVSLLMLLVVSLSAAVVMRNALTVDATATVTLAHADAQSAAEQALAACEGQLLLEEPARTMPILPPVQAGELPWWQRPQSWVAHSTVTLTQPPMAGWPAESRPSQCLTEQVMVQGGSSFQVTARGFSRGWRGTAEGQTLTGSVVWLQSHVVLGSGDGL